MLQNEYEHDDFGLKERLSKPDDNYGAGLFSNK